VSDPYGLEARARLVPEPPKRVTRSPFERDRARIVHSSALRRLAAKTQVLGAGSNDFVRNRLTHSLEVAQVARELGASLGCDPDIVDSAALAHDLGHPPFGHNGEVALDEAAAGCGGFEGNAQTLRLLTRLEAKTFDESADGGGRSVGLNLTRATLAACIKYPWLRGERQGTAKFGVYADDSRVFDWVVAGAPADAAPGQTPIETQVMDLSDDIAYSVHDMEDGVFGGWFTLDDLDVAAIGVTARDWYDATLDDAAIDAALARLEALSEWPRAKFDGSRQARAQLKGLTSTLIGRFVSAAMLATVERWGSGPLVRYSAALEVPPATKDEIAVLKSIAAHYVMRAEDRTADLDRERALLHGLVDVLVTSDGRDLAPDLRADFDTAPDDAGRLRVVIDQVASLTDHSAAAWGERLL
jgi:dGTPase